MKVDSGYGYIPQLGASYRVVWVEYTEYSDGRMEFDYYGYAESGVMMRWTVTQVPRMVSRAGQSRYGTYDETYSQPLAVDAGTEAEILENVMTEARVNEWD